MTGTSTYEGRVIGQEFGKSHSLIIKLHGSLRHQCSAQRLTKKKNSIIKTYQRPRLIITPTEYSSRATMTEPRVEL